MLRELTVLDGDTASGIKYTREVGRFLAQQIDAGFDGDLFLSVVEAGSVTSEQLDALSALCPCQLAQNVGEQTAIAQLFFVRDRFYNAESLPRRRSLQFIIHLSGCLHEQNHDLSELNFRACAYAGSLPNGEHWSIPSSLASTREQWAVYARNELLSVAIQALFYSVLDAYQESGLRFDASAQVVDWYVQQPEALDALRALSADNTFSECVEAADAWLPKATNWIDPAHEVQLVERAAQLSRLRGSADNRREIVVAALRVLIALAHRSKGESSPYGGLVFEDGYFDYYPINLRSFEFHCVTSWGALPLRGVLRWLLLHWGIEVHLRVALRKLRGQSQSTFRIRPSDRGLEVIEVPPAAHTRPRFNQAVRVLKDIGALEKTESGRWMPSSLGMAMVELGDAP